ncbi:MAG: endolytic transglycosylase MltG [Clostridia bacterium]|nr:endolytic transglycosylase MltG [Clostridia bacterium]
MKNSGGKLLSIAKSLKGLKSPWLCAMGALAFCAILWLGSVFGDMFGLAPGMGNTVMVDIPQGVGVSGISKILKEEGIIRHPFVFRAYEKLSGGNLFQQGGHLLGKGQSYGEIIKKLTSTPEIGVDETMTVLIPEGYEARQIAAKLAECGLVDEKEFMRELSEGDFEFDFIDRIDRKENRLEGYLFPATYEFLVGESEHDVINRMLDAFNKRIVPLYEQSGTSYSLDEIVTMASLVEREAANDSERGKVASVFYNRLAADMTLSSCATVQYIIKERKDILSNSDIKIKSNYNTYINKGLPIGPIASPGEASVKAALWPEDTNYLYFAARADGSENVFSTTGEQHLETVNRLQNGN